MYALISGFFTSLSLIVAIGAQNLFVLRQGLTGLHVFWLCLFCGISDAILITVGVSGFAAVASPASDIGRTISLFAAAFLFAYGVVRLRSAWIGEYKIHVGMATQSLGKTLTLAAAFTWANPHVYLDTVVLLGAVSTAFIATERWLFGLGAITASFVFFFSLGYGARFLAPAMQSSAAWRALDTAIGLVMWWLALAILLRS